MLIKAHDTGRLQFFGIHSELADTKAFKIWLAPLRQSEWVVDAREPFGGPEAVLAYLSRYTHRVAISNRRLINVDAQSVTFRAKNYRVEGARRYTTMTLATPEFIRRFLLHVLPRRFHRIRHYGLLANGNRAANVAKARERLAAKPPAASTSDGERTRDPDISLHPYPCCGGPLRITETFERGCKPRGPP